MSPADPKEKKRKRSSRSPVPTPRSSFRMAAKQEVAVETAQEAFDRGLQSSKDLSTQYAVDRRKLLQAESEASWDRPAKETADNSEVMAGAIIKCIREYERANTFGNLPGEALPGPETLDMGGQFLTNKSRIEQQSKLFEIAKLVPKGTILHLHFNAELHPKRLLEEARKMKTMCIRSTQPIVTDKDLQETEMVFGVKPENTKFVSVFSAQYLGKGANWKDAKIEPLIWMRWSDFRREFKRHYGDTYTTTKSNIINTETLPNSSVINTETLPNSSEQGPVDLEPAENWLLQKMVLGEEEAYSPNQTVNG
jgi:adenosine deaminase CECR1